jgi:hypothetical protein
MVRVGSLRASDADREQVAERLRQAAAEGRLLAEELEQRLARALRARTYAELDPLVADLPRGRPVTRRHSTVARVGMTAMAAVAAVAVVATVVAVALALITGLMFTWGVWMLVVWFFVSRRRCGMAGRRGVHRGRGGTRFVARRTLF